MSGIDMALLAQHLRKPEGEMGKFVAQQMNIGNENINQRAIEYLDVQAGDRILEVGMGNGLFCKDVLELADNLRYDGADFSQTMVEESERMNETLIKEGKVHFHHAPTAKLPFEDNTFDWAFGVNTIYFWTPDEELKELHRVLKPGGKLVIGSASPEAMRKLPPTQHGDFTLYEKEDLVNAFTRNSFSVQEIHRHDDGQLEFEGLLIEKQNYISVVVK